MSAQQRRNPIETISALRRATAAGRAETLLTDQFAARAVLRPNEAHRFEVRGAVGIAVFTIDQLPLLDEAIKAFRAETAIDDQRSDDRAREHRVTLAGKW